jgi:uncharacterized protein (TIGR03118 family)
MEDEMIRSASRGWMLVGVGLVSGCTLFPGLDGARESAEFYERTDLVSDQDGIARHTDENLINPWGIAAGPTTFFWVANNGSGTSTLYRGTGQNASGLVGGPVKLERAAGGAAAPTGIVYNPSRGFTIDDGTKSGPSDFLFATLDGEIFGWSQKVDKRNGVVAYSATAGTRYTGLALLEQGNEARLYATDFTGAKIDVFDDNFTLVQLGADAFTDPGVPAGYVPHGIQALGDRIYVTWVKLDPSTSWEAKGEGLGYIDVFDPEGKLIEALPVVPELNAPWGLALAPDDFGQYGGSLLVANYGDGRVTAFDLVDYSVRGQLESAPGELLEIDGLSGIMFGNGTLAGRKGTLYFVAGPDEGLHGLMGSIEPRK